MIWPRPHDEGKTGTILLKIPKTYQRQVILLSQRKLETFSHTVVLSRHLTKEEADLRYQFFLQRRELINDGPEPKNLWVRDKKFVNPARHKLDQGQNNRSSWVRLTNHLLEHFYSQCQEYSWIRSTNIVFQCHYMSKSLPNPLPHRNVADWKCQRQWNFPQQLHNALQRPTKCKWSYKSHNFTWQLLCGCNNRRDLKELIFN